MRVEERVTTMPVVALRGLIIPPGMVLHLGMNRPKPVVTVKRAMVGDQRLFFVAQRHPEIVEPGQGDLFQVGIVAVVKQLAELPGKVIRVPVGGLERAELLCLEAEGPTMMGEVVAIEAEEDDLDSLTQEVIPCILRGRPGEYGRANSKITREILPNLLIITDLNEMLDQIAIQLSWNYTTRQTVPESSSLSARYEAMMRTLLAETGIYRVEKNFWEKVEADIDQNQREYTLEEQMKAIRQELEEDVVSDVDKYQKKLDVLKAGKGVKEKLHKEVEHFRNMSVRGQEANVLCAYVGTLLDLSQEKMSKDNGDIKHTEKMFDEDHYGLEQVKERTLEYLAVRALTKKDTSPIICLVGPPGTGKISTVRSVARVLNEKYMYISLGGVRDEVEIRRHRKTYMGAMPGRIVEGMRQANVSNPLMLLDEIDKVSSGCRGDTSFALLEMLDGGQNMRFRDHYVEPPIDLSQVLFIATADTTQTIPGPLLDRMKLTEVNSCTESEKFHTAEDYLVSKQVERNGLGSSQVVLSDKSLEKVIHNYTREAGIRNLECRIGDVYRKAAGQFPEDKKRSIKISESSPEKYLGKEKMTFENVNEEDEIGIVRGPAWISVGGDTLQTEIDVAPGKGNLLMIGQLGDMTKESTQTTLTYVRSVCPEYGIADDYFEKHDLHIHIPESAVPKGGPSAGITMATAMLSTVTDESVQVKVAMIGEITLRGRVLPTGKLKEKILAAKIAYIEKVLVPDKNRPDVAKPSKEITKGLDIVCVKTTEGVVSEALVQSADGNQEKQI